MNNTAQAAVDSAAPEPGWIGRIWDAMNAGNTLESVRIAEETAAAHPESPRVLQTLTEIYMRAGKRNEALATVEQIADIADNEGNGAAGDILCMALQATGADMQVTYEAAKRRLAQEPNSYAAALVMQHSCFRLDMYDEALPAIMHTLNLLGRTSPQQSNLVLRNLVRISSKSDPERAARLFLA